MPDRPSAAAAPPAQEIVNSRKGERANPIDLPGFSSAAPPFCRPGARGMNIQADQPQHSAAAPDNQPALNATIARGCWGLAIRGTLGILLGFIIISAPAEDIMPLAVLASAFMLFEAVFVVALVMLR